MNRRFESWPSLANLSAVPKTFLLALSLAVYSSSSVAIELGSNWTLNIFTDIQLNWFDDDHDEMGMEDEMHMDGMHSDDIGMEDGMHTGAHHVDHDPANAALL